MSGRCRLLIFKRVAWGDGNRGWPLKQFDQMEEICNKVKSLAKRISKAGCMIWMVVAKVLPGAFKTYAKYCSQDERNAVNQKLKPHFLTLACSTYAVYLITKMLDNGQLKERRLVDIIAKLNSSSEAYVSCVATDFRKRNNRSLLLTQGNYLAVWCLRVYLSIVNDITVSKEGHPPLEDAPLLQLLHPIAHRYLIR
ncbi:pumilio homolog 24 [Tanacetum coccineum]